jgi:hypothetical protein
MTYDISINQPPVLGNTYLGYFYSIVGTGGYQIAQNFADIHIATKNPIVKYDLTNAVQVLYDVRTFNTKIGLLKDANNLNIISTPYDTSNNIFPTDSITISALEFAAAIQLSNIVSVGTYSTLYSGFNTYVNTYFNYANSFTSLFSNASTFDINGGVFDKAAFYNIIHGKTVDASGAYIKDLSGSVTIYGINSLLQYAVRSNVFANRDASFGTTASNITNRANYRVQDGFLQGDIVFVPAGTTVTLSLSIVNDGYEIVNNTGPSQLTSLNVVNNFSSKYGSNLYTESATASTSKIQHVLTAPLVFILANLSTNYY